MHTISSPNILWKFLFFSIIVGYCLFYAPFGVNETDGGFLTGLAWQVLNGKVLYQDIIYVRPPLSVWLRALELQFLPEYFAVLGERWIFYIKLAMYSWLAAAILVPGERRWQLAALGFVVSAHCYPPMAWHTVDGILFAVLAAFFIFRRNESSYFGYCAGGLSLFCTLLCKQSFYPLLPLFTLVLLLENEGRWKGIASFFGGFALGTTLFFTYLVQNNIFEGFLQMTSAAASGGQAFQHGVLDYFRITPELALPGIFLLTPVVWWFWKGKNSKLAETAWSLWLLALVLSYASVTWLRQDHTVPFAQSRAMFWVAAVLFLSQGSRSRVHRTSLLLLGISWCASVSWGYNLPILFATPWVWAGMEITRMLQASNTKNQKSFLKNALTMLVMLLLAFRIGHEFVYRDGRRNQMTEPMGVIFPKLSGVYSDRETSGLYQDLKQLAEQYGSNFKVLPAFSQANFLTNTSPPLPLDWVVNRETNSNNNLIVNELKEKGPVIFIQKSFKLKIESDPEMDLTRLILASGKIVQETSNFWVIMNYRL